MRSPIRVTSTRTQPIVVVQRAYQKFCALGEATSQTVYSSDALAHASSAYGFEFLFAKQQTVLATEPPVEDWLKFKRLVTEWRSQRGAMSSITEAAMCPAYQSIIGMGEIALPFILVQLESEGDDPDQWFWALRAIAGVDPVTDKDRGDYSKMAEAWLAWANNEWYGR